MRVLVADDTGAVAPTAIVFLAWWGHEVEVVHDGIEALRKARAWRPDVVLATVRLERMDGLSLLAALRAGGEVRDTHVVIVGPGADVHARTRSAHLGAAAYLASPVAVGDLARVLERLGQLAAPRSGRRSAG